METKDELVNHIKMWLEIDKEIQEYQKIIRELMEKHKHER